MSDRTIAHADFEIERVFQVAPDRVFAAFATAEAKEAWRLLPEDWSLLEHTLDFRIGGRESYRTGATDGPVHGYDARYSDIVENSRIVYSYEIRMDATLLSLSLATFEFWPDGEGTHLILNESGAYLDGYDDPKWREQGANDALDSLAMLLEGVPEL
jgi:uncharacterized protein YndB with AHSA1/START domain